MPSACKGRQWWSPTKSADRVLWWMLGEWWCWWLVVVTVSLHIVITIPICRDWGFATLPVSTCALQCAVFFSSSSKSVQIQVLLLVTFWKSLDRPSLFWIHPLPLINPTADQPRKMKSETNLDSAEIGAVQWFGWCAGGLLTTQAPGVCWQSVMTCVASTLSGVGSALQHSHLQLGCHTVQRLWAARHLRLVYFATQPLVRSCKQVFDLYILVSAIFHPKLGLLVAGVSIISKDRFFFLTPNIRDLTFFYECKCSFYWKEWVFFLKSLK